MECCKSRASESIPFIQGYYDQQGIEWMCAQSCWNKPSRKQVSQQAPQLSQNTFQNLQSRSPISPSQSQMRNVGRCSSCG
jgi:hypothetical protein